MLRQAGFADTLQVMSANPTTSSTPSLLPCKLAGYHVHMVGIGGSGMSGLAALLLRHGAIVTGTDACPSPIIASLRDQGAEIQLEQSSVMLPAGAQLLVSSAAVKPTHPEMLAAQSRGIPMMRYAQLLGALMQRYDGVAISGTHGKSTTSAWVAYALRLAGLDPSFVVGAVSRQLSGASAAGSGPHFVAEACEYDRSFLNLNPGAAAVLNIEEDHLDYYADLGAIQGAFASFAERLPRSGLLVVNGDDDACSELRSGGKSRVETFGFGEGNTWRATQLTAEEGRYSFNLCHNGAQRGCFTLGLAGRHNVLNALAVIALANDAGVTFEVIAQALSSYEGVSRRLEVRAAIDGVTIVDDYAHHPTEIRATLATARERFQPTRLWCIFQPHQHSRTRFLLDDFSTSLSRADRVIVPDIYFVRDSARDREAVCAEDLVKRIKERGGSAEYIPDFKAIVDRVQRDLAPGDVVMTMGAGTIWKVADDLVQRLGGQLPA